MAVALLSLELKPLTQKYSQEGSSTMAISFDKALGIHELALATRTRRAEVLAKNLANVDTPNFKARDVDFKTILQGQLQKSDALKRVSLNTTRNGHLQPAASEPMDEGLLYRTPVQPSIDGNTVDEQLEQAEFMKNALHFQASFTFLNKRLMGLQGALRGE